MNVGQAIKLGRKARGLRQGDLRTPYSQSMMAKIENDERLVAKDVAPMLCAELDHPAVVAEMQREFTGFGPSWLDGVRVDLHPASVSIKTYEEMREAMDAMEKCPAYVPQGAMSESEFRRWVEHLMQVMDLYQATYMYIGVQCLAHGYSMRQLSNDHRAKLRSLRYVASQ